MQTTSATISMDRWSQTREEQACRNNRPPQSTFWSEVTHHIASKKRCEPKLKNNQVCLCYKLAATEAAKFLLPPFNTATNSQELWIVNWAAGRNREPKWPQRQRVSRIFPSNQLSFHLWLATLPPHFLPPHFSLSRP